MSYGKKICICIYIELKFCLYCQNESLPKFVSFQYSLGDLNTTAVAKLHFEILITMIV